MMIRAFMRVYSTERPNLSKKGCRLLDYVSPATHTAVPRPQYLLSSRTGNRYQGKAGKYEEGTELATIWAYIRRKVKGGSDVPPEWAGLRDRLGLDPKTSPIDIISQEKHMKDLETWVDCIDSPDIGGALTVMNSNLSIAWPPFVVLHTFGRHGKSPLDTYNAMRIYEILLPKMPTHIQPELVVLMLRLAQKHLVDIVPFIIRIYIALLKKVDSGPDGVSASVVNELLWQIARYGKNWSDIDVPLLSEAQETLVTFAGVEKIDAKGMFALAYVTHFRRPELARQFIEDMKGVMSSRTLPRHEKEFAYANGPAVIKLLTSPTAEQALAVIDQVKTNLTAMWSCAAIYLTRKKMFTADVAMRLWNKSLKQTPRVRITSLLTELVIGAQPTFSQKHAVLSQALDAGIRLTPSLVAKMTKVSTKQDLDAVASHFPQYIDHALVLEGTLTSQCYCDPPSVWRTYTKLYCQKPGTLPSREALRVLCRAAWDSSLIWDGMYASQRALAEIKMHVRGIVAPADDLLRVYPDEKLLYAYLIMLGRSGYNDELVSFLRWMDELKFEPTKRMLLALIHYSPQGLALLQLGQKTKPPATNWPTQDEYEVYRQML